jgi:peptide/nickel transport system ATP-binding protein
MNELLKIRSLSVDFYTYEGVVKALDNLDLDINEQETFGLVGETGCGKTLTALSILRLIPPPGQIKCGSIFFNAFDGIEPIDLLTTSEREMREIRGGTISMIFQEPSAALNPVYTLGDQISEGILIRRRQELGERALETVERSLAETSGYIQPLFKPVRLLERGLYRAISRNPTSLVPRFIGRIPLVGRVLLKQLNNEARKIAITMLRDVEIPDAERIFQQYPHQLSGGMKQRCVIAMALVCCNRFLIADEPTTALDVTIQAQILELLRRIKVELGSSILYITHDLAVAAEICDRIGVMYSGTLCEVATAEELYAHPLHPYTEALMAAVPKPGKEPHSIAGFVPDPFNLPTGCRFHPRCDYCTKICKEQVPTMCEIEPGHSVACHNYQGGTIGNSY